MKARRPDSHDHMISFIHYAYGLMTLLIDMVPRFKNLWFEWLGDLTSYMMCLENTDSDERETWNEISSNWYHKALDENPGKGSLYHRLDNLSKPNIGRQLFCYSRSLMATKRYERSKSCVESVFNMALDSIQNQNLTPPDTSSCTSLLIAPMNDRIDDMERFKSFEKHLGNALDRLSHEICDAGRDDSDITRFQGIYQKLEYFKSKVEDARILKECTMDETEAVLKKFLTPTMSMS
ncbi:hypothetical protein GX51_08297 [Blastomyces parvus]|uniref:Uncharacterized protein n=1 Tax=Blastomyces parvus TaxID=2060905 RepID=A0A2B7WEY5_9EURO|nr:hypothetical protein GX51_08297 [Blastomyces parvus]